MDFKKFCQSIVYEAQPETPSGKKPSHIENFNKLWEEEWKNYVKKRRTERYTENSVNTESVQAPTTKLNLVGLALSGGGIRSATFNLGLIQSMAYYKFFKYIDYISTVSGGGYIGSSLTSHFYHQKDSKSEGSEFPFGFPRPGGERLGEERPEVRHLRNHSNYLAPKRGLFSVPMWKLVGAYLSGLLVLVPIPLAILIVFISLMDFISRRMGAFLWPGGGPFLPPQSDWSGLYSLAMSPKINYLPWMFSLSWIPPGLALLSWGFALFMFTIFLISVFGFLLSMKGHGSPQSRNRLGNFQAWTFILMVIGILVASLPALVQGWFHLWNDVIQWGNFGKWTISLISLAGALGANKQWKKPWLNKLKIPLIKIGVVAFLALTGLTLLGLYREHPSMTFLVSLIVLIVGIAFLDPDRASLHFFYRDRLSEAYVVKASKENPEHFDPDHHLMLKDICPTDFNSKTFHPPYHLINATINLTGDSDPELKGRKADLFLFSPLYCGSEKTGWKTTEEYENGELDLATAMAISGAAVSSQMGMYSNRPLAMLMTLLNIRLGSWRRNPLSEVYRGGMLSTLFLELLAQPSSKGPYVNLSDGGHFENLGLYSLIQRRCKYIIISDAGADESQGFSDLGNALRKIRIDLGVRVKLNLSPLLINKKTGYSPCQFVVGEIFYPLNNQKTENGLLIYLRPTLTGEEPPDLLAYQRKNKAFPHESTIDQFFNEAQFESYRTLGFHAGREIFEAVGKLLELPKGEEAHAGGQKTNIVEEFFTQLTMDFLKKHKLKNNLEP